MLNSLDQHCLCISRSGVPLIPELIRVCLSNPKPEHMDQALIWLGLLNGLDELGEILARFSTPAQLPPDQAVALYAAMHLTGNPAQGSLPLQRLLARSVPKAHEEVVASPEASSLWQVMNIVMKLANSSSYAALIRQANLMHLADPSSLLDDWLAQLEEFITARMPFPALLRISILCRNPQELPSDWQRRLADAITAVGNKADAMTLYRFWMVACQVAPDWDFASIRASDLALQFEEFAIANHLLEQLERNEIQNAWFYDVKARCRYGYGCLLSATRLWSMAIAKLEPGSPERHVFQDRMLSALRGKYGLAEASRLARSGESGASLQLLRTLILNDPGYSNHYRLLASLRAAIEANEKLTDSCHAEQPSVGSLLQRCHNLWTESEDPIHVPTKPEEVRKVLEEVDSFLSRCEQSLALTPV